MLARLRWDTAKPVAAPLHPFRSYRGIAQLRAAITSFDHRTRRIMRAHHHLLM